MTIRADFPILRRQFRDKPIVYLDSAATTQKPQVVIDTISHYYEHYNSNVHRAAHVMAGEATEALENSRASVCGWINAELTSEIVFTRGTTESINLVAHVLGDSGKLGAGDEIVITEMEHHSNIVPWQMLAQRTGATLRGIRVTPTGELDLDDAARIINERTRILACGHVSNALGTVNPVEDLLALAASHEAITIIDGAQAALHQNVDVQALGCDFYCFSGHKIFGPTGIGVLYGKQALLEALPPWQGGGEMIERVTLQSSTYQKPPYKFEAGTPHIAGAIGLGAAINYLQGLDLAALNSAEEALVSKAVSGLQQIPGVQLVGEPNHRSSVVSFIVDAAHPHDVGTLLDQQGVAVRTGHHCTMPLMDALNVPGTIRASFSLYSNDDDVTRLLDGVAKALTFL
jgi:cysteine desulfurase / selenocysteine lyase